MRRATAVADASAPRMHATRNYTISHLTELVAISYFTVYPSPTRNHRRMTFSPSNAMMKGNRDHLVGSVR